MLKANICALSKNYKVKTNVFKMKLSIDNSCKFLLLTNQCLLIHKSLNWRSF